MQPRGVNLVSMISMLSMVVFVLACHRANKDDLTAQQWTDLINEHLPAGSSRDKVEKFLDQHHIEHSYIAKSNFPGEANSIIAFARGNDDHNLVKKSGVQLKFKLDENQRLASFECREMFTGP